MFDALSDKLQRVFSRLSSHGTVTEKDLDEALREVRVALLEADVNFRVVRDFIAAVRERAVGAEVLKSLTGPAAGHRHRQRRADEHARRQPGRRSRRRRSRRPSSCSSASRAPARRPSPPSSALHLRKSRRQAAARRRRPLPRRRERAAADARAPAQRRRLRRRPAATSKRLARDALDEARRIGATALIVDSAGYLQLDEDVVGGAAGARARASSRTRPCSSSTR